MRLRCGSEQAYLRSHRIEHLLMFHFVTEQLLNLRLWNEDGTMRSDDDVRSIKQIHQIMEELPTHQTQQPTPYHGLPNTVVLTTTNTAFINLTQNWITSIQQAGVWPDITVIAEDRVVYDILQERNDIQVYLTQFQTFRTNALPINTPLHNRLVNQRPYYIKKYLQRGMNVLFNDVDIVWLGDPFPHLEGDYDVFLEEDQHDQKTVFSAGFVFYRATDPSLVLIKELIQRIDKQQGKTSYRILLNEIIDENFIPDLKVKILDPTKFPNGILAYHQKDLAKWRTKNNPLVIHNNWKGSRDGKVKWFKDAGLWYLSNTTVAKD